LTFAARLGIAGNAIAPNLTALTMKLSNRFLPRAVAVSGDKLQSGWESRSQDLAPRWITGRADAAIAPNNEAVAGNGAAKELI